MNNGQDGDTCTINGIECVLIKAGTFMMGISEREISELSKNLERLGYSYEDFNDKHESSYRQHQVTISKDYWLSKYPVTQKQYRDVMENKPLHNICVNNPIVQVNWFKSSVFCEFLGGRLPTEAEWEFAARGGNKSKGYIYSGSNNIDEVAWYWGNIPSQSRCDCAHDIQPIGQKLPNELGIYDMSGNVWEWCNDWYGDYPNCAITDPIGPNCGSNRVIRGGYWYGYVENCLIADRNHITPSHNYVSVGFRVVFDSA